MLEQRFYFLNFLGGLFFCFLWTSPAFALTPYCPDGYKLSGTVCVSMTDASLPTKTPVCQDLKYKFLDGRCVLKDKHDMYKADEKRQEAQQAYHDYVQNDSAYKAAKTQLDTDLKAHDTKLKTLKTKQASQTVKIEELEGKISTESNATERARLQSELDGVKAEKSLTDQDILDVNTAKKDRQEAFDTSVEGQKEKDLKKEKIAADSEYNAAKNGAMAEAINKLNQRSGRFDASQVLSFGNEGGATLNEQNSEANVFNKIIRLAVQIVGTLAVLFLIVGGFMMITANGEENKLSQGKQIVTFTLIGVAVVLLSYTIIAFVMSFMFSSVAG